MEKKAVNAEVALQSFLQVFEQYRGMIYAIALRMLGQGEDAKDAVQETFIKAYTHLHTLHDIKTLPAWLKSIVYNHCLMELRYREKSIILLDKIPKEEQVFEEANCNLETTTEEIKNILAGLSEILQLTFMLRFFGKNSSYQEIAYILGIPVGTVRSRLAESKAKLASLIMQQDHPEKNNKAKEMEDFYLFHFLSQYDNVAIRNALLDHFDKKVLISLTSGRIAIGSDYVKEQVEFDLQYGARAKLTEVHSSGNISILELSNINPPEYPDLCPLSSTFIFVHPKNKVEKAFLHNSLTHIPID
ncbi:MAG TPA: sigma-70 family RNA polymerase sigma factor [Parafilimonas sp.]|nr:sigma-70 family RNA polymerase sigma factor [Parafilimonas sp.]